MNNDRKVPELAFENCCNIEKQRKIRYTILMNAESDMGEQRTIISTVAILLPSI